MKISSVTFGEYKLALAGTFITFPDRKTVLELQLEKDVAVNFEFEFFNKEDDGEKQEIVSDIKGNTVSLKLYNFNNPLGTGSKVPIHVGTFGDTAVFFSYRIYALDKESDKTFIYTFYTTQMTKQKSVQKDGKK